MSSELHLGRVLVLISVLASGQVFGSEQTTALTTEPSCDDEIGALVCEAARVNSTDPKRATELLGEALDKEQLGFFDRGSGLFSRFAKQARLNLPVLRFLKSRNLDLDPEGRALQSQIWQGQVENVRQLLELGANPNERQGNQQAALFEARQAMERHPVEAMQIARLLIEYGADPNILLNYDYEKDKVLTEEQKAFEKLMDDTMGQIAAKEPVRIDFFDFEAAWEKRRMDYARFFVINNTEKEWNLGFVRDSGGIEYSGANVALEYVVYPGTRWRTYVVGPEQLKDDTLRSAHFKGWQLSLVRVPVSLYDLMDAPPGLRLRLRIRASDGTDFVSAPFALHDGRYVRGDWPLSSRSGPASDSAPEDKDYEGKSRIVPRAKDIPGGPSKVERNAAPHGHPLAPGEGSSTG